MSLSQDILLTLILLCPLIGSVLCSTLLRNFHIKLVSLVATSAIFIPFLMTLLLLSFDSLSFQVILFDWININSLHETLNINFSLKFDRLSSVFLLIITGVASCIHFYSTEYMKDEKAVHRFFSYLNLFVFSMLVLVLGGNMLVTFLGWEGVGLCSYLLIGYWYQSKENSSAALKAFLMNRIGDIGFLIAMFIAYNLFGSIDYETIFQAAKVLPSEFWTSHNIMITCFGLSLFLAVSGKSAQIPLYTWLPDAMAGPTPVSALIHAATMVTAGIYLMTRTSFLLVHSDVAMQSIAILGAATCFLGAIIAVFQNDIKKVLAYSTVSQLGYMVMACGVGAFEYGVGHVVTHAFFKALLFLAAGSVIHAMHHEQDIRKMGGLLKKMPVTGLCFIIGTLAISGIPPFSGFFSKDMILSACLTFPYGSTLLWTVGFVTAALTAFYMFRLTTLVFFGESRALHFHKIKETNFYMLIPLCLLAFFALFSGVIILPEFLTTHRAFISDWLSPNLYSSQRIMGFENFTGLSHLKESLYMAATFAIVLLGGAFSFWFYKSGIEGDKKLQKLSPKVFFFLKNKCFVDEFYELCFIKPFEALCEILKRLIEKLFLNVFVSHFSISFKTCTHLLSDAQTGDIRAYSKVIFISLIVFGTVVLSTLFL